MSTPSASPAQPELTALISALGTLIGYLGAEASTDDAFERILWPQRFFTFDHPGELLLAALFMSAGGPLHRGAIQALDHLRRNGFFRGAYQKKMLGTVFFRDEKLEYSCVQKGKGGEKKQVRNGMFARVARAATHWSEDHTSAARQDGSNDDLETLKRQRTVRRKFAVDHAILRLEDRATLGRMEKNAILQYETGRITVRNLIVLLWTEAISMALAGIAFGVWRSFFGFLWLIPVVIKLLASLFSLPREPLNLPTVRGNDSPSSQYQVDMQGQDFLVVEGNAELVLQFFRHYGHPIPHTFRESVLLALVVLLGLNFFAGLLCSILWMPVSLQYLWLGYQLYATIALFVYRYIGGTHWLTTESRIASKLAAQRRKHPKVCLLMTRESSVTLEWRRVRTAGFAEGRAMVRQMLAPAAGEGRDPQVSEKGSPQSG